jgi:predicted lipid-binding transport protein (Tim44 family)
MDGIPYADIVILALIAGFILLRLRSVLGQKTGNDDPQFFKPEDKLVQKDVPIVQVGDKAKNKLTEPADAYMQTVTGEAIIQTIAEIKKLDPQFIATNFLQGAKMAYEMVFDGFAKGDKKTLEMLLDKPIYDSFAAEIDARALAKEKTELTLVSVRSKDILRATLVDNKAQITVKFDSEQVSVVKDEHGTIIGGSPNQTVLMDDEWTFERDVASKNPNWKIIET